MFGGLGKASDITGTSVTYAGGGGGAYVNSSSETSTKRLGGAGGSGGGGNGAGVDGGATGKELNPVKAQDGTDGLGGGGGGGASYDGVEDEVAGKGGNGVVIIRLSGFVIERVPLPKTTNWMFDGNAKTGVVEFYAYTLTGTPVATNSDWYSVTATIKPQYPFEWDDTEGGQGPRLLKWHIAQMPVTVPIVKTTTVYNGQTQYAVDPVQYAIDADGYCHMTEKGVDHPYCKVEGNAETDANSPKPGVPYTVNISLSRLDLEGKPATNYIWRTPSTMADQPYDWWITQASNAIVGFTYPDTAYENMPNPQNQFSAAWGKSTVIYEYREESEPDAWKSWGTTGPTVKGNYVIRLTLPETRNWQGDQQERTFGMWIDESDLYTDWIEITLSGYGQGSSSLTDFPVPVYLHEPLAEDGGDGFAVMSGFEYARAGATGKEMHFFAKNSKNHYNIPVEHEVDEWNIHGTSIVWVRVPSISGTSTKLKLCWNRIGDIHIPAYDGAAVWTKYSGVWHFSQTADSRFTDSTGNDRGAYVSARADYEIERLENVMGPVGKSLYLKSGYLFVDNDLFPFGTVSNRLTYSAWYQNPGFKNDGKITKGHEVFAGLKYDTASTTTAKTDPGWAIRMNNGNANVMWETTGQEASNNNLNNLLTTWSMIGVQVGMTAVGDGRSGTGMKRFYTAQNKTDGSLTINTANEAKYFSTGVNKPLQLAASGFRVDEARVSTNILSDTWLKEENNSVLKAKTYCTFNLVHRDCHRTNVPSGLICDWWSTVPGLSKTMWKKGQTGATRSPAGTYKSGATVTYEYFNPTNGASYGTDQPTDIGFYRIVFDHAKSVRGTYRPLSHAVDFYIVEPAQEITDLGGSASGRILLMNADNNMSGAVTNQGWSVQSPEGTVTYWVHHGDAPGTNNILPGASSTLYRSADNQRLWDLVECRHGNTFPTNDTGTGSALASDQCYLRASGATALSVTNEDAKATRSTTGWILMRNTEDACVYSPVYSNGVGTIYFDAVNSRILSGALTNACSFVVETTTNVLANLTDLTPEDWVPQTIRAAYFNGTSASVSDKPATKEFLLMATTGATETRFYRVHVPVGEMGPIRFRIRRTGRYDADTDYDACFILLDNLIVSFPTAQAKLEPYGHFDESTDGRTAVGYGGAFDVPFPSVSDGLSLTGRCTVAIKANEDFSGLPVKDLVSMAQMFYRWRYLGQAQMPEASRGDWNVAVLKPDGERSFRAESALSVTNCPGDVEFYFAAVMKGDYYKYVDYTGYAWPVDQSGYTEDAGLVETHRERTTVLPTGGTDWYVRLRDGRSAYEGVTLFSQVDAPGAPIETNRFELTADGQWTLRLKAATAAAGGLRYRISGFNPQTAGSTNYVFSRVDWQGAASADRLPATVDVTDGNAWRTVPCDAATDYLFFQLDETRRRLQCAHCEWQDFSLWASAINPDGLYVGNATDTNATSTATKEYNPDWDSWEASQSTSANWSEDFKVSTGQVASVVYPRNKPFATAMSLNGWQVENAMWTYAKWSLQNNPDPAKSFGDDSAAQLQGRGIGSLAFMNGSIAPDGLDSIRYTARVAQYNEFNDFTYFDTYLLKDDETLPILSRIEPARFLKDTTVVTFAALTETGPLAYDGDGSVSLVNYYDAAEGCYEFRVSRGTNDKDLRLSLFRWRLKNGAMVCEPLLNNKAQNWFDYSDRNTSTGAGCCADRLVKGLKSPLGGIFLSAMEDDGKTLVTAGVCETDADTFGGPTAFSGRNFTCITYHDNAGERLTHGSFGMLACNCPGVFVKPICYRAGVSSYKPNKVGELQSAKNKAITFTGNIIDLATVKAANSWVVKKGRTEALTGHSDCYGWQAKPVLPQKVAVEVCVAGTGDWKGVVTNTVNGFTDNRFTTKVRDPRKCNVRLKGVGTMDDVRTDIVVNEVELSQWNGQWTPNYNRQDAHYLKDEFVYTAAWVKEDAAGMKSVLLQPSRATRKSNGDLNPVSLRSPMMRGLGLLHFRWRNADSRAKLKVQVNEIATEGNIVGLTESMSDGGQAPSSWETIREIEFGNRAEGSMTIPINRRYHGQDDGRDYYFGLIRLVVDEEVEKSALAEGRPVNDDRYGQVEIVEAYAWDLPEYDKHSWTGWNFRAAGWNGAAPDEFANLTDGLRGLSGLLNNTLDPATLADREKSHYQQNPPHVQSPVFRTNCVGAVTFKARLYETGDLLDHPAVVSVYGTRSIDEKTGEPVAGSWEWATDVEVTNRFYETYSVKLKANDGYKAIRLGVRGVEGVIGEGGKAKYDPPHRVAIDDICLWERSASSIAFRGARVRPFRDADAIKGTGAVKDIEDISEQPLAAESFGFQAEIVVEDPEEVMDDPEHPITVELWYYAPKAGETPVWGYDNWKTNDAAVHVMLTPATDTNHVYRSTVDVAGAMCPPQFLEDGEPYRLVQYHMVAHFYHQGGEQDTHELQRTEWVTPEWYLGFPDPNASAKFSAYTLVERLAPRRAWINEVNFVEDTAKASVHGQWIELAVPSGEDMTGWKLDLYDYEGTHVGTMATIGEHGLPASKTYQGGNPEAAKSHYAFYTIKSPYAVMDRGTYDGSWSSSLVAGGASPGELPYNRPFAFTLTRPTGVIEHRVVVQGKNEAIGKYWYWYKYEGTNLVEVMHEKMGGTWTWAAEDFKEHPGCSVGVVTNQGALHAEWVSPMAHSPSEMNDGQYIDPNWLIRPNGGYVWIYSTVIGDHLRQVIGGVTNTVGSITVQEGTSTNIQYIADRWYELASCEVDPPERTQLVGPVAGEDGQRIWTLEMNLVSNRIDVVATSGVAKAVRDFLTDAGKPYAQYMPAIMKWLQDGVTGGADGGVHPFKNPDGPLLPMHYRGTDGTRADELKFPDMYWLDVDPTAGDWELWGGMGEKGGTENLGKVDEPAYRQREGSDEIRTNRQTTVWLELRNDAEGLSYPPYRLQGLGNEKSDDPSFSGAWTSANFKVTMALKNGKVDDVFQPMRYFVFDRNSFRPADDPLAPFAARIEVLDPFCDQSPAAEWGWKPYWMDPVLTGWALDGRVTPDSVTTLKKDDTFDF